MRQYLWTSAQMTLDEPDKLTRQISRANQIRGLQDTGPHARAGPQRQSQKIADSALPLQSAPADF